ncbi:MAG: hypothetical protein GY810_27530 [Aureispira sp.]|nr:hypothetical protein [Aureispira sp.]
MQNHNELLDDTLANDPKQEERREKSKKKNEFFLFLIHFFLLGTGLFYVDKNLKRCWFYLALSLYAWFSFINVFIRIIPDLEPFHNKTFEGAMTIFIAWGIVYVIGTIDAFFTLYRYKKL